MTLIANVSHMFQCTLLLHVNSKKPCVGVQILLPGHQVNNVVCTIGTESGLTNAEVVQF
jgi:hypothetical protein